MIPRRTPKRARQEREYAKLRAEYLERHWVCQAKLSACTGYATEIHHKAGRIGERLTNTEHFCPICRNCHDYVTNRMSAAEARERGLKV
jgi:hypothetical protein